MSGNQEHQRYLPMEELLGHIQTGNRDLSKLRTTINALQDTSYGKKFARPLENVTSNTDGHAVLRNGLHGLSSALYDENLSARWEVARNIQEATGLEFNPAIYDSKHRKKVWEALQAFTGMHVDDEEKEKMSAKLPGIYPPSVYDVWWMEGDDTIVRQDDLYTVDKVQRGHIYNVSEYIYTFLKNGKIKERLFMAEFRNYDESSGKSITATTVTDNPLSQTYFSDKILGRIRNEFVYLGSQSPYIQSITG